MTEKLLLDFAKRSLISMAKVQTQCCLATRISWIQIHHIGTAFLCGICMFSRLLHSQRWIWKLMDEWVQIYSVKQYNKKELNWLCLSIFLFKGSSFIATSPSAIHGEFGDGSTQAENDKQRMVIQGLNYASVYTIFIFIVPELKKNTSRDYVGPEVVFYKYK